MPFRAEDVRGVTLAEEKRAAAATSPAVRRVFTWLACPGDCPGFLKWAAIPYVVLQPDKLREVNRFFRPVHAWQHVF
jgi:hypothetical protein